MTRPLIGHSEDVARFVATIIEAERGFGPCEALGFLDREGRLEAGVVYHNYSPENGIIELSAGSIRRNWGTRDALKLIFSYPFDQLGCQAVVARTGEHNQTPLRIWRALGAAEYRIPRLRGRDEAEIVTVLTVEQWKDSKWVR